MSDEKARKLVVHTRRGNDGSHLIYEMAECHPDFFTKEETWRLVEQSAYDELMKDAIKLKSIISLASGCAKIVGNGPLEKLLDNAITDFDKKYEKE